MTRPDFNAVTSTAAALAVAIWSTTMLFAATYVPAVSSVSHVA